MKKPNLSRTLHRGLAMILAFALLLGMLPAAVQPAPLLCGMITMRS